MIGISLIPLRAHEGKIFHAVVWHREGCRGSALCLPRMPVQYTPRYQIAIKETHRSSALCLPCDVPHGITLQQKKHVGAVPCACPACCRAMYPTVSHCNKRNTEGQCLVPALIHNTSPIFPLQHQTIRAGTRPAPTITTAILWYLSLRYPVSRSLRSDCHPFARRKGNFRAVVISLHV